MSTFKITLPGQHAIYLVVVTVLAFLLDQRGVRFGPPGILLYLIQLLSCTVQASQNAYGSANANANGHTQQLISLQFAFFLKGITLRIAQVEL